MKKMTIVFVLTSLLLCNITFAGSWTITQLTDNSTDDTYPAISGTNVVWMGWDGSDYEIYSNFAGQLTNNDTWDTGPSISGTNVVWTNYGSNFPYSSEIHSNFAGQITDNDTHDDTPAISGTNVVWSSFDSVNWNYVINSNFAGQLSKRGSDITFGNPRISGRKVVWSGSGPKEVDSEIYSNFAGQMTNNDNITDYMPAISGENVVWYAHIYYVGTEIHSNFAGKITDDCSFYSSWPSISGTNVVWSDQELEIRTNFGGVITNNYVIDINPSISGTNVVWQGWDGNDYEIFMATYGEALIEVDPPVWVDEVDNMVVPYDRVTLEFTFRNESAVDAENVHVDLRTVNESISFVDGTDTFPLILGTIHGGEVTLPREVTIKVDGIEEEPKNAIMTEIIENMDEISLEDAIEVTVTGSNTETQTVEVSPVDEGGNVLSIQYPDFSGVGDKPSPWYPFYGRSGGDLDFHHPADPNVRHYAIEASLDGNIFPDRVDSVVNNIYDYINTLLRTDNSKGIIADDAEIARAIKKHGRDWVMTQPDGYLCIGQAYLFTSFARTIGVPARELTTALALDIDVDEHGVIQYKYQEGGAEVWYDGSWRMLDTFMHVKNLDDERLNEYIDDAGYLAYRSWYAYDRRDSGKNFSQDGLLGGWGHSFGTDDENWTGVPVLAEEWKLRDEGYAKEVLHIKTESPVHTYVEDEQDRRTGSILGQIVEEIPSSYYTPEGTVVYSDASEPTSGSELPEMICLKNVSPTSSYTIVLVGIDDGHYDLTISYINEDGTIDFSTVGFNIHSEEKHTYDLSVGTGGEIFITGLPVVIDIDPDTLNLKSKGKWITCYIELPEGYDVSDIDIERVFLEYWLDVNKSDVQGDTLMIQFDRQAIINYIEGFLPIELPNYVTLELIGELSDGTTFEGEDTIRIIEE